MSILIDMRALVDIGILNLENVRSIRLGENLLSSRYLCVGAAQKDKNTLGWEYEEHYIKGEL